MDLIQYRKQFFLLGTDLLSLMIEWLLIELNHFRMKTINQACTYNFNPLLIYLFQKCPLLLRNGAEILNAFLQPKQFCTTYLISI